MSEADTMVPEAVAEIVHEPAPVPLEPHPFGDAAAGPAMVVCPVCHHAAPFDGDASRAVLTCSECGARIAFGVAMPRLVIEPSADKKFVVFRFSGPSVKDRAGNRVDLADILLDPQMAKSLGLNVLSIV